LEVRKLGKESSFLVETKIAQAGIRGTQFKVSASADSAELSVLEGRVDFLDAEKMATPVETAKKAGTRKGVTAKLEDMSASEQAEVKQAVERAKGASASIDLNRLANTVDGYEKKPNYIVKSALNMELIWCPPGSFIMGGVGADSPAHPVILTRGFYLGKFEVTQEQYKKVMDNNPSEFKGNKLPVDGVSWDDAVEFCNKLTKKERMRGWQFSLPTEAQWEYTCRGGTTTDYSWGDSISSNLANYEESGFKKTVEVGSYLPNTWGFYDMHGNVREWCLDWKTQFSQSLDVDPLVLVSSSKTTRVRRGGSWVDSDDVLLSAFRLNSVWKEKSNFIGFRVALVKVD
jgi:formylglycine-generating enzyme required for sulfatase activity